MHQSQPESTRAGIRPRNIQFKSIGEREAQDRPITEEARVVLIEVPQQGFGTRRDCASTSAPYWMICSTA
jgi:hypothetical protein